jgi:YidC/Oxa1 family membrane protein insertase
MGCLPLLVQFPILIGLYQAIIALLGSSPPDLLNLTGIIYPWVNDIVNAGASLPIPNRFLWLNLAQPDPFYVMPILIFVTMFASQKLMTPAKPKAVDGKKAQEDNPMAGMTQSMQYTMPIMFAFFALSFPSGLSIYWILSNVIGVAQSYLTRYSMAKEKAQNALKGDQVPATTGIPDTAAATAANGREANVRSLQKSKQATSKRRKKRARR